MARTTMAHELPELTDLTDWAREAGLTVPVAVTRGVWEVLEPSAELEADGEDVMGRAWDMLTRLRDALRGASDATEIPLAPLLTLAPGEEPEPIDMVARVGPGHGGPVSVTVAILGER